MIAELAAVCPPGLAPFASGLTRGPSPSTSLAGYRLRERDTLAQILAVFGRRFPGADERALLSYWTQFYFTTLIVPAVAALVCLRREYPVALDAVDLSLDKEGRVRCFWMNEGLASEGEAGLATLVFRHLTPFIDACVAYNGVSRRTLWCNAGAVLDFALANFPASALARHDASGDPSSAAALFFAPFCAGARSGERRRRICCLRCRLPGVAACAEICPVREDSRCRMVAESGAGDPPCSKRKTPPSRLL